MNFIKKLCSFFSIKNNNIGYKSTQQNAGRDINYINTTPNNRNIIRDKNAWDDLLKVFQPSSLKRMLKMFVAPNGQQHFEHNIKGYKESITKKFEEAAPLSASDIEFSSIHTKAINAIDSFAETKNQKEFQNVWADCSKSLKAVRK